MEKKTGTGSFLSGNALKLIAAAAMTVDHVGILFFPQVPLLRILGRLAYPIFAYMIAEGCRYTRSRKRYFLQLFTLAVLCQTVYYLADGSMYLSILFTFSCSVLTVFALQEAKKDLFAPEGIRWRGPVLFAVSVAGVWILNRVFTIDYGFWGCMVPVFASAFQSRDAEAPAWLLRLDRKPVHVLMLALGLTLLGIRLGGNQMWALLALPLLLLYSGKRGTLPMKYFFYIFYPLHLALLQVISWLL